MSLSPTMKETVLPHHPPSPLSSHAPLSPQLLTPDSDQHHRTPAPGLDTLVFTKQPIPRKPRDGATAIQPYSPFFTESEASDGHLSEAYGQPSSRPHSPVKSHHLSLLTAVLSSPDHNVPKSQAHRAELGKASIMANGGISGSSNPSTTMSSPAAREPHGILQNAQQTPVVKAEAVPPSSILRRESATSGTGDEHVPGVGLGLTMNGGGEQGAGALDGLAKRLEKVEERRERIGWADKVEKVTPSFPNLARVPSAGSSIGPRPRLQFAVAHPPSHGSTSASETGDVPGRHAPSSTNSSRRPSSPFAKERKVQESLDEQASDAEEDEEDEEEEEEEDGEDTPLEEIPRMPGYNSRSTSSSGRRSEELHSPIDEEDDEDDLGYQEDEEDGMFSDEEETTAFDLPGDLVKRKFAFARPTNYSRGRRPSRDDLSPATTPPPPAPTFFPPPNRRGRGHVRVADPTLSVAKTEKKGCTRHCSPPPSSRSRSGSKVESAPPAIASPSARFMKRPEALGGPGPSKQRIAGSPMPPRVFMADSDEDEDDEEDEEEAAGEEDEGEEEKATPPVPRGGWRSDDSVFYGPNARVPSRAVRPFVPMTHSRNLSAPLDRAVFDESADEDHSVSVSMAREASMEGNTPGGVRHWIRRASELSGFSRPSIGPAAPDMRRSSGDGGSSTGAEGRSRDVSYTAPIPSQATVPPALDHTPIAASSFSKHTEIGGCASRLEQTLSAAASTPSSTLSPAPAMSRDTTRSSVTSTSVAPTPSASSSRPTSGHGAEDGRVEPLNRAVSMSNRVTFRPTERPIRAAPPQRSVSAATHYLSTQKAKSGMCGSGSGPSVMPIKCPKRVQAGEDLGWSDEALMSIRRKAGKGEH